MHLNALKVTCLALSFLFSIGCFAQTQHGVVKTRGRLDAGGKLIEGERLSDAVVTVKGRNPVRSGNNGEFSFPVPGKFFFLQSVKKQDYSIALCASYSRAAG